MDHRRDDSRLRGNDDGAGRGPRQAAAVGGETPRPLTRDELLARGRCCKLGCRECPYG